MARGSFNGLYTFDQVAKIYNMDNSTLRKMVQANKFTDKDIKKFGKTWIITEDAIGKHFGLTMLRAYEREEQLRELAQVRESKSQFLRDKKNSKGKIKKEKSNISDLSSGDNEDVKELGYIAVDPSSIILNFQFKK